MRELKGAIYTGKDSNGMEVVRVHPDLLPIIEKAIADANPPAHSGDDERDAEEWVKANNWDYQKYGDRRPDRSAYGTMMNYEISDMLAWAFTEGRKGMVPASDVKGLINQIQIRDREIAEAVKAERERCAQIAAKEYGAAWSVAADRIYCAILNPTPKDGEAE